MNCKKVFMLSVVAVMVATLMFSPVYLLQGTFGLAPRYGGTLIEGIALDCAGLSVWRSSLSPEWSVIPSIYSYLYTLDTNNKPVPDLAESWIISEDYKTLTFNLAHNVTWHDGYPFTSADVVYSYQNLTTPYHIFGSVILGSAVDYYEAPDDYTVIIHLKFPSEGLMLFIAMFCIGPKHIYEGTDILTNPANTAPIGTGPYKFQEWVRGDHITLVRNENYFKKGMPYLDKIIFQIISDRQMRYQALISGDIDTFGQRDFPFERYADLKANPDIGWYEHGFTGNTYYIPINLREHTPTYPEGGPINPLSILKVRQAMYYALNRTMIFELAYYGAGSVCTGGVVSAYIQWAFNPNVTQYEYNPDKANQLLDEAGYPKGGDGIRFATSVTYYLTEGNKAAELMREMWRAVGIDLRLVAIDKVTADQKVGNWEFDMHLWNRWSRPDPGITAINGFHSKSIRKGWIAHNMGGYNNSRVDELLNLDEREGNKTKRREYLFEVQSIIMDELPGIWLFNLATPLVWRTEYEGFPRGYTGFETYRDVWWTEGTPWAITDVNEDGAVNILDISAVARAFLSKPGDPRWDQRADLDNNDEVNILDISKVARDFGKHI